MSRKEFIESQGATCRNWNWSWSFINKKKKVIIFGAWEHRTDGNTSLILDESWERNYKGKKNNGYQESLDHIRLVESGEYKLMTFPIIRADVKDKDSIGPSKIKRIIPELKPKVLKKVGASWYASDNVATDTLPEEVSNPEKYIEGASRTIAVNAYERSRKARDACIRHYGAICVVCGFNFTDRYGAIGEGLIHVHHLIPLSEIQKQYKLDPVKDLRPVCPNCHAVIHSTQPALSIDQLRVHLGGIKNA